MPSEIEKKAHEEDKHLRKYPLGMICPDSALGKLPMIKCLMPH